MKRMFDYLQLTDAIANIFRGDAEAIASKREEEQKNIIGGAAAAATKIEEKHWNMSALTVKEIKYILFAVYNFTISASKLRNPNYMACLMVQIEKYIREYERFIPQTSQDA